MEGGGPSRERPWVAGQGGRTGAEESRGKAQCAAHVRAGPWMPRVAPGAARTALSRAHLVRTMAPADVTFSPHPRAMASSDPSSSATRRESSSFFGKGRSVDTSGEEK